MPAVSKSGRFLLAPRFLPRRFGFVGPWRRGFGHGSRRDGLRWRYGHVLCQAFEVLDGCGEQELIPCTGETAQAEPCQGEDVFDLAEEGFDLLAFTTGGRVSLGGTVINSVSGAICERMKEAAFDTRHRIYDSSVAGGGFEQAYNPQATVAAGSLLVVTADVVQATNDKQQIEPALEQLGQLPDELGKAETLLADSGYFSQTNVEACAKAKITPLIALGRERHHLSWKQRFAPAPPAPDNPTAPQAMIHRLATPGGRKTHGLRKQTPEPVFGIIKSVMGFRQFHLRGLDQVKGEWNLVTLAWNMKRMFAL